MGPDRRFAPYTRAAPATLEWVDWFNNRRLLVPIGNIPPVEAEQRYYATLDEQKLAA
jgi:putative transposase